MCIDSNVFAGIEKLPEVLLVDRHASVDLRCIVDRANLTGLVLGGGGGRPDYLQKLKVPEGYEKMIDYSNI